MAFTNHSLIRFILPGIMKKPAWLTLVLAVFVFCSTQGVAQNVAGLLLTVDSSGDSHDAAPGDGICGDSGGGCTLRAAVEETNANSTRDAVIFGLPHPAVIDLTLGELLINQNLDIVGPGARRLTVRRSSAAGTPNFRVIHITSPTAVLVNIRGVTIKNGNDLFGGGIFVETGGIVGLYDSTVSGNHGQLGGGIMSSGRLTIVRCLIASNTTATTGGAIAHVGSTHEMTVSNSTITGNSAVISAGAIYNEGTLLLVNDTISANSATQSVSSIQSNAQGTIRVINTIIGRDAGPAANALQGAFVSGGNNIVTNSTGSTGFANGVNEDQVSEGNAIDPLLGPLADNGGQTDTLALLAGSPAIKGGNACVRTAQCPLLPGITLPSGRLDQRRFRRSPIADKVDVGALDTDSFNSATSGTLVLLGAGGPYPANHFTGSSVFIINPTTLERRHTRVRLGGNIVISGLGAEVFVIEIRSKRRGMLTPLVFAFD
jgi:hypothetical protein